jgi:hypothetical protein
MAWLSTALMHRLLSLNIAKALIVNSCGALLLLSVLSNIRNILVESKQMAAVVKVQASVVILVLGL